MNQRTCLTFMTEPNTDDSGSAVNAAHHYARMALLPNGVHTPAEWAACSRCYFGPPLLAISPSVLPRYLAVSMTCRLSEPNPDESQLCGIIGGSHSDTIQTSTRGCLISIPSLFSLPLYTNHEVRPPRRALTALVSSHSTLL